MTLKLLYPGGFYRCFFSVATVFDKVHKGNAHFHFLGFSNTEKLVFRHSWVHRCVFVHEQICSNLCTHFYYAVQLPLSILWLFVSRRNFFSLCHLSAVWRTSHVGLDVSLRVVLQPSFSRGTHRMYWSGSRYLRWPLT